jgi:hypothetical protein
LYTINILNSSEEKTQTDIDIFFAFWKYIKKQTFQYTSNICTSETQWNSTNLYYSIYKKKNVYLKKKVLNNLELDLLSFVFDALIVKNRPYRKIFFEDSFFITTKRNFYTMDVFSKNSTTLANYLNYKQLKSINITQQFI